MWYNIDSGIGGYNMKLTRKKAIELCVELWEWLAITGGKKKDWPEWKKYDGAMNNCWFCEYQEQQVKRYKPRNECKNGFCRYCPLTKIKINCLDADCFYIQWDSAKMPRTRKKYAKLFLEQIRKT